MPDGPDRLPDSSAGAMRRRGCCNLRDWCKPTDQNAAERYRNGAAPSILDTSPLTEEYLAFDDAEWEGVLKHGVSLPEGAGGPGRSKSVWGVFFLEAVDRALKSGNSPASRYRDGFRPRPFYGLKVAGSDVLSHEVSPCASPTTPTPAPRALKTSEASRMPLRPRAESPALMPPSPKLGLDIRRQERAAPTRKNDFEEDDDDTRRRPRRRR